MKKTDQDEGDIGLAPHALWHGLLHRLRLAADDQADKDEEDLDFAQPTLRLAADDQDEEDLYLLGHEPRALGGVKVLKELKKKQDENVIARF